MAEESASDQSGIFNDLWRDKDYRHSVEVAAKAAAKYAPFLTKVATAVDIRCGGALGTRSVRKQIQSLIHFSIGNMKMRVNANELVLSTAALVVSPPVGAGKNIYQKLFMEVLEMILVYLMIKSASKEFQA